MATLTTTNGNTTATFAYTTSTATMLSIAGGAAEYLWDKGYGDHGTEEAPIVFADLTNQEKLDILDDHLKGVIVNLANTQKSLAAQEAARLAEEESKYDL